MNTDFQEEIENLYNKFSYENINFNFILGNYNTNFFDSNLDKKVYEDTLNKFITQNNWVEIDRLNYCIYEYKNNFIKIYPNNFKTNHQKKYYYSSLLLDKAVKENSINNYIENKAKSFKILVSKDVPIKMCNINKGDKNINKRSLLEIENDKLFTNYFIPCINDIKNYQLINKLFFKFSDTFSLHFDETMNYNGEKLINTFYKIYLKIEINNDIANSLDNTINSKILLPSDKQIVEKMNDIISFYNNEEYSIKFNIINKLDCNNYPKSNIFLKLPYNYNREEREKNEIKKENDNNGNDNNGNDNNGNDNNGNNNYYKDRKNNYNDRKNNYKTEERKNFNKDNKNNKYIKSER